MQKIKIWPNNKTSQKFLRRIFFIYVYKPRIIKEKILNQAKKNVGLKKTCFFVDRAQNGTDPFFTGLGPKCPVFFCFFLLYYFI